LFDPEYYLGKNPDVRETGIDPLIHFIKTGWKEGRNPSKDFDINYYLETNPDIISLDMNPLVHYIRIGKDEGRLTIPKRASYNKKSTPAQKPTLEQKQSVPVKKRLTKNIVNMSVAFIRTYGFKNFLKKVINNLFPKTDNQDLLTDSSLQIIQNNFIKNSMVLEKEIEPFDVKISVVIPTKDAGNEFDFLAKMLKQQRGLREVELVIVDSGSTDDTLQIARQYDAKILQIPPEQFSHSYTRNLGAENASGDYLLFMVQDALPPNRTWLYELLTIMKANDVSAVSCAESPREDADLFYRCLCWNHYKFLGVHNRDRIFQLPAKRDYNSLRKNAQLADLACLISKETFSEYKFRHDYGEDLDLGLRLITDGKRLAFSGEIRIIHSHNRPAYYFLKRGYVDNLFIADLFDDFMVPRISQKDLLADIAFTYQFLNDFIQQDLPALNYPVANEVFRDLITTAFSKVNEHCFPSTSLKQNADYKDQQFIHFVEDLIEPAGLTKAGQEYDGILAPVFFTQVNTLLDYLDMVYEYIDDTLIEEIKACLFKQLSITIGTHLSFGYIKRTGHEPIDVETIHSTLKAGV
jgi:glycosyltransferase involved in cell wall biosynthesis